MTEISRVWDRGPGKSGREPGRVGLATLRCPDGAWYLSDVDGSLKELPSNSVTRLLEQALSPMTDAHGGKVKLADGIAAFEKVRSDLIAGRYNARTGGGADPILAETRRLVMAALKAQKPDVYAAIEDADDRDAQIDAYIEKQKPAVRVALGEAATANVAARDAERAQRAAAKAAKAEADAAAGKGLRF